MTAWRATVDRSSPLHLRQRRLGLRQPERHLHRLVHRDSRRQLSTGLFALADRSIPHAQTAVAVGQEWAHTESFGESEGLTVIVSGRFGVRGRTMRSDGA